MAQNISATGCFGTKMFRTHTFWHRAVSALDVSIPRRFALDVKASDYLGVSASVPLMYDNAMMSKRLG